MSEIGPVQLLAIGFGPDANFEGRILAELAELEKEGTVRVLDLLFVAKEEGGDLIALEHQLRDKGVFTPEDFEAKKNQLLGI
jgi:hypothetical protein